MNIDETVTEVSRVQRSHGMLWHLFREKGSALGLVVLVVLVSAAVFAPWLAPSDPASVDLASRQLAPVWSSGGSWSHILGTDALGRDVLSSVMYGARTSFLIAISVVVFAGIVGTALGLIAGFRGGWPDTLIMRTADAQVAFPAVLLVALLAGALGAGFTVVVVALTVFGWMVYARLVRSAVLKQRQSGYIIAAELTGCSPMRIMRRHLLPNLAGPLLTQALLEFAAVVLAEAAVSYLGFGVQPPTTSWGLMISENQQYMSTAWWSVVAPGMALALTVLSVNLVGSAVRSHLDPHQGGIRRANAHKKAVLRTTLRRSIR